MYGNSPDVPRTALAPSTPTSFGAATRLRGLFANLRVTGHRLLCRVAGGIREALGRRPDSMARLHGMHRNPERPGPGRIRGGEGGP